MNHELVLLLKQIDWDAWEAELEAEAEFAEYYCADNGRLSVAIRRIVGMVRKMGKMSWWRGCC
jgi:hypothetical protein